MFVSLKKKKVKVVGSDETKQRARAQLSTIINGLYNIRVGVSEGIKTNAWQN